MQAVFLFDLWSFMQYPTLTRWTWVWAGSGCWWWTGKPGVLQSMGSQLSDWTEGPMGPSMRSQMARFHAFFMAEPFSSVCVCDIFFIRSSLDGRWGCFQIVAILNNSALNIEKHACFELVLLFSLYVYPGVQLLDHIVVLFLAFCGSSLLFSIIRKSAVLIYIPTDGYECSFLPHPHLYVESKKETNKCI